MEKYLIVLGSILCSLAFFYAAHAAGKPKQEKWVVYYGAELPSKQFLKYDTIVFDSQKHPSLRPLMNRGKTILGYLSIGEVEGYRADFDKIKAMGAVLEENPNWPGRYVVDVRNPQWVKYLIEEKIPQILHKKFDGLMLDTIDSALYLWQKDPTKYKGMDEAAVALISTIRRHYPRIKLMLNRGFEVLPEVAPYLDSFLAESIMVNTNTESKEPEFFPEAVTAKYDAIIQRTKQVQPKIKVYSLDYWDPTDEAKIVEIYKKQRARGYLPYVTTIDLMQETVEPK